MGTPETIAVENAHMPPFFAKTPISIERGEGVWVWDEEGRRYLDLTAGWGVTSIGHAHPGHRARAGGAGRAHHPEPRLGAHVLAGAGEAARAARRHPAGRAHPGLLHQQRRRGQRRGRQAGAQGHRPHRGDRHRGQLPRPHHQHGLGHRPGQAPRQVPAADAGLPLRALRPRGRRGGGARRRRRGDDRRAGAGRGRRAHPRAGLPARALAALPRQRLAARRRRGPDRLLPHRAAVRDRRRRRRGRLAHHGQGHRRRLPARRLRHDRGRRRRGSRPATTAAPTAATRSPARSPRP